MGQVPGNEVSNPAGGYTRKEHRDGGGFRQGQKASIHPLFLTFHRGDRGRTPLWRYSIDPRMLSSGMQGATYGIDLAVELLWLVSMGFFRDKMDFPFFFFFLIKYLLIK